jgi:hypothetical protein
MQILENPWKLLTSLLLFQQYSFDVDTQDAECLSHPRNFFNIDEFNLEEGVNEEWFIRKTL